MAEPLKNMYSRAFVEDVISAFQAVTADFDGAVFMNYIFDDHWEASELKARMRHITRAIRHTLPGDYRTVLAVVRQAAASPLLARYSFETMIVPDFVECFGVNDPQASIPALEQFTQQSSAEFAIRPFILRDMPHMMARMLAWTQHESHHVRRLASEGCRPRLPWAMALPMFKKDPAPILPILEALKQDKSDYVRRSVANNLNDMAKDNPQVVIDLLRHWNTINDENVRWIIRHALRSLVKQGHSEALELLGYGSSAAFEVKNLTVEPAEISLGSEVRLAFLLVSRSTRTQNLMVDYVVHHMKANGRHAPKTFKLAKVSMPPGAEIVLSKKHSFRPITTRRYYPGEHIIEIQINGKRCGQVSLMLNDTNIPAR
jgi:3-methyladenine DNA glycosylase AlkC